MPKNSWTCLINLQASTLFSTCVRNSLFLFARLYLKAVTSLCYDSTRAPRTWNICSGPQATIIFGLNSSHLLQILQASQPLVRCHPPTLVIKYPLHLAYPGSTYESTRPQDNRQRIIAGLSLRPILTTIPCSPHKERSSLVQTITYSIASPISSHTPRAA